jgi:hypothetical protein
LVTLACQARLGENPQSRASDANTTKPSLVARKLFIYDFFAFWGLISEDTDGFSLSGDGLSGPFGLLVGPCILLALASFFSIQIFLVLSNLFNNI